MHENRVTRARRRRYCVLNILRVRSALATRPTWEIRKRTWAPRPFSQSECEKLQTLSSTLRARLETSPKRSQDTYLIKLSRRWITVHLILALFPFVTLLLRASFLWIPKKRMSLGRQFGINKERAEIFVRQEAEIVLLRGDTSA